jgi:PKD repeat protein
VDGSGSTDPDGGALTYRWSWGDGTTSSGVTASKTYTTTSSRTVTLTVTDDGGRSGATNRTASPCRIVSASFTHRSVQNSLDLRANDRPESGNVIFSATTNRWCSSMTVVLPRSGGTVSTTLTIVSTSGDTRTWTSSVNWGSRRFIPGAGQIATVTGAPAGEPASTSTITFGTR